MPNRASIVGLAGIGALAIVWPAYAQTTQAEVPAAQAEVPAASEAVETSTPADATERAPNEGAQPESATDTGANSSVPEDSSTGQAVPDATSAAAVPEDAGIEEIVVTSQKRTQRLQDVPIAVTALTADELSGSNIDGQLELPKLTPNLNFTVLSTFAAPYIRGVGTQFANPGLESSVSVYYDDTYLPRAISSIFNFNDISRIEVLKGPQGTLYGRNATGGAIRIITNDPKLGVAEGAADITGGTDNRVMVGGMANLPIGEKMAVRIAAQMDRNDGYIDNLASSGPDNLQDRDAKIITAKFLATPSDKLTLKISADYADKNDTEGFTFVNLFEAPTQVGQVVGGCVSTSFDNACIDNRRAGNDLKAWGASGRLDYVLEGSTVSSITTYRRIEENDFADLDGTSANLQHSHGQTGTRQFTQEVQWASDQTGRLQYVGGWFYLHEQSFYNYYVSGDAIDTGFGALGSAFEIGDTNLLFFGRGPGLKVDSIAPYVQLDYALTDKVSATVGARYTVEKKTLLGNNGGLAVNTGGALPVESTVLGGDLLGTAGIPGVGGNCVNSTDTLCKTDKESVDFNKFTPKLTLSYKPITDLMLYATVSTGFKSGGLALPAFGYVDQVKPETLRDIEGGWKYQQGNLRFNGAIFYYKYEDLQLPIVNGATGTTNTRNAATARNYGIESDAAYKFTSRLEVGVGGGYLHAEFTDFPNGPGYARGAVGTVPTVIPDLDGYKLPNASKFTGYVRAQYLQPLEELGQVKFSTILNYRSKSYFDVANQLEDESRTLLSARIQWFSDDGRYTMGIYGENLTDEHYYTNAVVLGSGGFQIPAEPRQIFATVGMRF